MRKYTESICGNKNRKAKFVCQVTHSEQAAEIEIGREAFLFDFKRKKERNHFHSCENNNHWKNTHTNTHTEQEKVEEKE